MSAAPVLVRPATAADVDAIAAGNIAMARETESRALDPQTVHAGVQGVFDSARHGVYYVAERNGKVAGQMLVTCEWSDWRNGEFWWIQSVYVWPAERGSGAYAALHAYVEARARATAGVCGLRLYVEKSNARARRIYERHGMHATDYRLYEIDFAQERTP